MKILYGVPGEGMGHATRSKVVIAHLLENNHDVHVVSSSRAFHFLNAAFPGRVSEIEGFHLSYKNSKVSKSQTAFTTLKGGPNNIRTNIKKYFELKESFHPDIIISDFESFSFLFGKRFGIPVISIDNMQIINRCKLDIKINKEEKLNHLIANGIIKSKVPSCSSYLITTFFYPETRKENTQLVPPILRAEILDAKPSESNHILVYQTSQSQGNLITLLKSMQKETFYVYGFNKDEDHGNVTLKKFSETGFIADLVSCKAVIANGGFSLMSEAVYLKKPVCSIPVKNQFEQFVNASYLNKLGYGRHFDELNEDGIKSFLYDLDVFKSNLKEYNQNGNKKLFDCLDELLGKIHY
jgi:uncharacterized protein (TIGR00661 family)